MVNTYPIAVAGRQRAEATSRDEFVRARHRGRRAGGARRRRLRPAARGREPAARRTSHRRAPALGAAAGRARARCSSCCRWSRCSRASTGRTFPALITSPSARDGAAAQPAHLARRDRSCACCSACPMALVLARTSLPRPGRAALAGAAAAGAAAGRRRHRAALHLRPARAARRDARGARPPGRLLDDGRGDGADLRGAAVPRRLARGRAAHRRRPLRGGRRDARRPPDHRLPPGDAAAGAAGPGLGRGAVVRPGARGVRRHHHLRRQPRGRHPHAAAGDLPRSARPTPTRRWRCRWCWSWSRCS